MTKFMDPKFSVTFGGDEFGEGWERIFGKRKDQNLTLCKRCGKMQLDHKLVGSELHCEDDQLFEEA